MNDLYRYTSVKELKFKDFDINNKKINVKLDTINKKFGILIFYRPDCKHCKDSVYIWSQLAENFKKFNIMSYNVEDFDNKNDEISQYISIPSFPKIKYITKNGTLKKFDEKLDYDSLFFYISRKLNY